MGSPNFLAILDLGPVYLAISILQLLECRLDNVVYRLGIAPTRAAARQFVSHRHITLSGTLSSLPLIAAASHSNQEYLLLLLPLNDSLITSSALDFSLTATTSPGRT